MIQPCPDCTPHEFQDKTYGNKQRVMNPCKYPGDTSKFSGARCTVCGKVHKARAAVMEEERANKAAAKKEPK